MTKKRGREDPGDLLSARPVSLPKRSRAATESDSEIVAVDTNNDHENVEDEDDDDDDYTSSSGSSSSFSSEAESENAGSEEEEEDNRDIETDLKQAVKEPAPGSKREDITYIRGHPKPKIHNIDRLKHPDLLSRISTFLPQLQAANVDLERRLASGNTQTLVMDDAPVGEGEYIEMNLGLGVLKEKRDGESESHSASDSNDEEDDEADHVMDRLMGIKSRSKEENPGIQEVDEG
ncbi:hypothetical protein BGW36DRAFT_355452 [Talaromyces proteolyticus]|uniref:Uncharacterized protein n=1 Tax=Talaromyces proteolyticus TaxID=1131652 RepID=A0AAD4Q0G6_9EURO|nr:uncharacterized protein BGW36DRAFT_355452 [Talaromyces proteolyticus]KAH8704073.1 hypothetical protein BGW36DRAFT_355452 [Talaromyces proteolyticus]